MSRMLYGLSSVEVIIFMAGRSYKETLFKKRFVDANALITAMNVWDWQELYLPIHFKQLIDEQPTADVVEVVRCKDCVYWEQATPDSGNCNRALEITAYATDYCSYGERREDGE